MPNDKDRTNWKETILADLEEADAWSRKHNKRVYLSEWGAPHNHEIKHVEESTAFMVLEMVRSNIEWSHFCGVFSNAWSYGLNNSEWGLEGVERVVKNQKK